MAPACRIFPSCFGDNSNKPVNLFIRGCDPPFLSGPATSQHAPHHRHLRAYADAEHRDRHRSSWASHPR
eukprot:1930111-Pleurochrysis_carterae.AAC.1